MLAVPYHIVQALEPFKESPVFSPECPNDFDDILSRKVVASKEWSESSSIRYSRLRNVVWGKQMDDVCNFANLFQMAA